MKHQSVIALLTATALGLTMSACNSNSTSEKITFSCESRKGVPTTVAQSPRGDIPVIRWVSDFGSEVGYDPQKRCDEVSNRFQKYYNKGVLNFVTTGRQNNQNIVCISSDKGGTCQDLLFTLKPKDNPSLVIKQMFEVASYASGPIDQSSGVYIDMKKLLAEAPVDNR